MALSVHLKTAWASLQSFLKEYLPELKTNKHTSWILATTTGAICLGLLWRRSKNNLPPEARGLPFLGNLLELSETGLHEDLLRMQKTNNLPDMFLIKAGPGNRMMILNSQKAIKEAFVTAGEKFANRPPSDDLGPKLKDEIMFKDYLDPTWNEGKTFVMSLLRTQGLGNSKGTEDKIIEQIQDLQDYFDPMVEIGEAIDLHDVMPKVSANIIFEILFNKRYSLDDPELQRRVDATREWYLGSIDGLNLMMFHEWFARMFFRKQIQAFTYRTERVRDFIREEVKAHLTHIDAENPRDFLEGYLSKKKSDEDIIALTDTVFTFLPDSLDTVGACFNWVLLYLAHHREVQSRAYEEILGLTEDCPNVTLAHRPKLPFCEAVMMEAMRVSVPIPLTLLHAAVKDTTYKGFDIPCSMPIIGNLYAALKDPEVFEDPDVFNPERFLNADGKLVKTDNWIPFGMGRRKCLGDQLSRAEVFLVFTNLVKRYSFSLDDSGPPASLEAINTGLSRVPQPFKLKLQHRN